MEEGYVHPGTFIPNILIRDGGIIYNSRVRISDLLHEAGHLAIIPEKYRYICNGDMDKSIMDIWEEAKADKEIEEADSHMYRALMQSSDTEATAWAWAAGKHLCVPENKIIAYTEYQHTGKSIRSCLKVNCYLGIHGLRASDMIDSVKSFPALTKWVQTTC